MHRFSPASIKCSKRASSSLKSTRRYCFISSRDTIISHHLTHNSGDAVLTKNDTAGCLLRFQFQNLHCFWKDQLAIHTFFRNIANHAVACKQLTQFGEGTAATVTDVVVTVITEGNGIFRCKCRSMHCIAKHSVRFSCLIRRLPDIGSVVVLQLSKRCQCCIVHDERCILSVWTLEGIHQIQNIIGFDCCGKRLCNGTTASCCEQAKRFTSAIAVKKSILFCICQRLTELGKDVILQIERIVIQKLLSHLDGNMEFVCIQKNLAEGRITKSERTTLFNPCSGRFGSCDIDFVFTTGRNGRCKRTHDVLLRQSINQTMVIFLWYEVTAIGIHTFLKYIAHTFEVGTECLDHCLAVFVRCTSGLFLRLIAVCRRLGSQRSIHRLIQFCLHLLLTLHAGDLFSKVVDVLLHLGIGSIIFCRKRTFLGTVGIQECLRCIPCFVTLFSHF
nr:MAG TPA: hypothetical protein [Caudoviricetes sp.]